MPLVDLTSPAGINGVSQLAGPYGNLLGGSSFPSSYEFAKRFVNNSKSAYGSGANGVTSLDDPTYLGFSLMFDISSPLFNGATSGPGSGINDGEFTVENTVNQGIAAAGQLFNKTSKEKPGGDLNTPSGASAIGYLEAIGEVNRAQYLKAFIQGIQEINNTRPYYFQTIAGIQEAWQKSTDFSIDPYTGSSGEEGITIGCLEAIDLKLTALFSLYKMAVYDSMYKRFILPKNLMKFDVYVYVQEIRKFKTTRNWLQATNPSTTNSSDSYVNQNASQVGFKFTDCEWDPKASGKVFEGVTNSGGEITTTEIKWTYALMENVSQFAGYNNKLDASKVQTDNQFFGKVKAFAKDQVNEAIDGALDLGRRAAVSFANPVQLGNVFDMTQVTLGGIGNPQALRNALVGAAVQGNEDGLKLFGQNENISQRLGDNPLGTADEPNQTISGNNQAFDPVTPPSEFSGGNAFGPSGPPNNSTITNENIFN